MMESNHFWARAPAQLSYPEPYRMAQPRMAEPRFPLNPFYRGVVDFSSYYQQPPFLIPPNMGYTQYPNYYQSGDVGYRYEQQSKWNELQPSRSQDAFPNGDERFTSNSNEIHSNIPVYESESNSQMMSFSSAVKPTQLPQNTGRSQYSNSSYSSKPGPNAGKAPRISKAVENSRIPEADGPQPKVRRLNPPMPMLPPPKILADSKKSNTVKTSQGKSQLLSQKGGSLPSTPVLSNTRVMAGSIQQLMKWNGILHKTPPLYETAGHLTNLRSSGRGMMEYHFSLRNLREWHNDDWGSEAKLLDCIMYAEPETIAMPYSGTVVRAVGRFQPSGLFQCLKVRKATEDDKLYLRTKLGLSKSDKKTAYGPGNSLNSSVARETSYLSGLDSLHRAPIMANSFLFATGGGGS